MLRSRKILDDLMCGLGSVAGSEIPVTPTDVSEPPAEGSSDNAETAAPTTNEAPNKGEVESSQLGEQSTPDEVCEEKENDLEIEPENPG